MSARNFRGASSGRSSSYNEKTPAGIDYFDQDIIFRTFGERRDIMNRLGTSIPG
jgi:hypothetical protein